MAELSHGQLWDACKRKPSDFESYGQRARLTANRGSFGTTGSTFIKLDCSCECKWFHTLSGPASLDWGVCGNPASPRAGLLTFEHQGCPEFEHE
jgi:hypothetical protein